MTCRELIEFLMDYTDGHLPPEVKATFDDHLSVCPSCVAYLDTYKQTVVLARGSMCENDADAIPASIPRGLVDAIIEAQRKQAK